MRMNKLWLNVGSGAYPVEGFINLDSSIFLTLLPVYPLLKPLIKPGHAALFEQYREAKRVSQFVRHDCRKPLPYADNSADHILCSHFLEHVFPTEAEVIMRDFYRTLKPNGTLHIILPSLEELIDRYCQGVGEDGAADLFMRDVTQVIGAPPTLTYRVLDFLGYQGMQHRWMYDRKSFAVRVRRAGFRLIGINDTPSKSVRVEDGAGSIHFVGVKG